MKSNTCRIVVLAATLFVAGAIPATAQTPTGAVLTLPVNGSFRAGGEFEGSISINRFEQRGTEIVAIGFVRGVLSRANRSLGTAVAGEVAWPVRVRAGGQLVLRDGAPDMPKPTHVTWPANLRPASTNSLRPASTFSLRPASAVRSAQPETCGVLNLAFGPITIDLMGVQVALSPVTFDLVGVVGTPLGDLVCALLDTVGTVADVVNLLNSLLGLITGLLGGLLGGLGGGVPVP